MRQVKLAIIGPEDHEVFGSVAERLEGRGFTADFLEPGREIVEGLEDYDLVLGKKSWDTAIATVRNAEAMGVETVNGFMTHMLTTHNPASYWHASEAGINVPDWSTGADLEPPLVKKPKTESSRLLPELADKAVPSHDYFYQDFVRNPGIDYKIYGVEVDGRREILGVETGSKILDGDSPREVFRPDDEMEDIASAAMDVFDARLLGVDVIDDGDDYYAVDFNSAPSYRGTAAEELLADSLQELLEKDVGAGTYLSSAYTSAGAE